MSYSYEDTFDFLPEPDAQRRVAQDAPDRARLSEAAAPQVQRLRDGVALGRELGGELREGLRNTVQRNPLLALAAALAVGLAIGRVSR